MDPALSTLQQPQNGKPFRALTTQATTTTQSRVIGWLLHHMITKLSYSLWILMCIMQVLQAVETKLLYIMVINKTILQILGHYTYTSSVLRFSWGKESTNWCEAICILLSILSKIAHVQPRRHHESYGFQAVKVFIKNWE